MKLRDREDLFVLGGFLGAVALAAALLLFLVSFWTAGPIRASRERTREKVFKRLMLPEFDRVGEAVSSEGCSFMTVYRSGKPAGFIGQGSTRAGYGGEIEGAVGFDLNGRITAVQILRHKETPGLGANVCERKFQRTILNLGAAAPEIPANRLLDQYAGRDAASAGGWKTSKDGGDFAYHTGATVTSRAVTALVDEIAAKFARWRCSGKEVER